MEKDQIAHVISLSGGCVEGVWSLIARCTCGWSVHPPKPSDAERIVREHRREVEAA